MKQKKYEEYYFPHVPEKLNFENENEKGFYERLMKWGMVLEY